MRDTGLGITRYGQKERDQNRSREIAIDNVELKMGAFQSSLSRNTVVKLASFLLVPNG